MSLPTLDHAQTQSDKTNSCLFCHIISGKAPSKIIAENDSVMVIESIRPMYTSHWLIMPKKHIVNIKGAQPDDAATLAELMFSAQKLSKQLKAPGDFQFNINNGAQAGQTVFHMHVHFLSNSSQIVPGKLVI